MLEYLKNLVQKEVSMVKKLLLLARATYVCCLNSIKKRKFVLFAFLKQQVMIDFE